MALPSYFHIFNGLDLYRPKNKSGFSRPKQEILFLEQGNWVPCEFSVLSAGMRRPGDTPVLACALA